MWERTRHHYMSLCFSFTMMVQISIAIRHWCEFWVTEFGKQQQKWRAKNNRQCYGSRTVHAKVCWRRHTWSVQMNGDGYLIRNSNGIFSFYSFKSLKFCAESIEHAIRNPIYLQRDNAKNDDVCYTSIISNSAEAIFYIYYRENQSASNLNDSDNYQVVLLTSWQTATGIKTQPTSRTLGVPFLRTFWIDCISLDMCCNVRLQMMVMQINRFHKLNVCNDAHAGGRKVKKKLSWQVLYLKCCKNILYILYNMFIQNFTKTPPTDLVISTSLL